MKNHFLITTEGEFITGFRDEHPVLEKFATITEAYAKALMVSEDEGTRFEKKYGWVKIKDLLKF
jgi:hypothetical protein